MEKLWLKHYPSGVPHEIDADAYPSILDVIEAACAKYRDQGAFHNLGLTLSFTEIEVLSREFAAYLQSLPDLKKGDRIALQMPNLLQYPIALFGALRAGFIVVNTNPLYSAREMEFQFKDSGAKLIVICANFAKHLEEILPRTAIKHVVVTEIGDMLPMPKRAIVNFVIKRVKKMVPKFHLPTAISFREALARGATAKYSRPQVTNKDLAFIQYTGGTTGVSKGAMLTHRNIVANMEQVAQWMRPGLKEGAEICIAPLPLYHVFSLSVNCLAFFNFGTLNVLITNARDIPGLVKEMKKWKFTLMTGVNTLFNALLNNPDFASLDFSSLKASVAGAMALQKPVAERWHALTKTSILEGYGLTETSPVACCNPLGAPIQLGTVGMPVPSTEVKLINESGKEVALGESGEICVRGPQVMSGYYNRPDESAQVFIEGGWMRTGDIGQFAADGFLKIVDRQKDMIIVSGFKVYPNEVEEVLASHPKVVEAGVVGIPDEHSGEVVKAFVVKRDPSLTAAEVIEHAKKSLTNYKVPKQVVFLDSLPKTNVGKILRRELR